MTPIKSNRAPLTKRISVLAMTAAAALSFVALSPTAHAQGRPSKELTALQAALTGLGESLATADASELAQAVSTAIAQNPKLKPGNIAGEALKNAGSNAQDAGDEIATALVNLGGDVTTAARDAIKRAGSGKTLNVDLVPDFAAQLVNTNEEALALAKLVKSSKAGAGAVIGGRASELATEADQLTLANQALVRTAGLTAAAQDIAKWVVAQVVGDTADFTRDLAVANPTLAPKIGTGGVAGDPTNGGNIVDTLLSETGLPKLKSGVSALINSVGKVADIEEISKIAIAVGKQIGTPAGTSTAIKLSKATGIVKSLAKAIVAKTTSPTLPNHSTVNKQDEIAEVAAYMVGQVLNLNTINGAGGGKPQINAKNAPAKILALVTSAVNAAKGKKVETTNPGLYLGAAVDVAGSVAETLGSLRDSAELAGVPDTFFDGIIALLVKKASAIGGKANVGAVTTAINDGYTAGASTRYEDGTVLANAQTSDSPESDFRPF